MGVISNWRKNRELKKLLEKGKQDSSSNSVLTSDGKGGTKVVSLGSYQTSNYQATTQPSTGSVSQAVSNIESSGGSYKLSRGSGSSSSSSRSSSPTSNPITNSNTNPMSNQVTNTRTQPTRQELLNKNNISNDITISRTGRVRQGNREYIGNALVGDTGKTANQLSRETREQYKRDTGQAIGQGRLSGKITYEQVEVEPGEVYSKDTKGESIFFNSKPKPESIKDFMTPTEERKPYVYGTKTFSFFDYEKKVSKEQITSPLSNVRLQADTIAEQVGKGWATAYTDITNKTGKINIAPVQATGQLIRGEITGREFLSGFKKKEGNVMLLDLDKGTATLEKNTKPSQTSSAYLQPQVIENVGTKIVRTGMYFTPVGTALFTFETAELGLDVGQTLRSGDKLSTEQKTQLALTGGIILGAAAIKGTTYLKTPIVKQTSSGFRVTSRWDEFAGKRFQFSKAPQNAIGVKTNILPSQRGINVKYEVIKKPKVNLQATESFGVDQGKKVIFPEQKILQQSTEGQRTIVTKFVKGKEKELYSGVYFKDKVRYEDTLEMLSNKIGKEQAKNILRYRQPIVKQTFTEGQININNNKAIGTMTLRTEQPSLIIDKNLGIKTRAGKGLKQVSSIDRVSIYSGDKVGASLEKSDSILLNTGKKNVIDLKGFEFKQGGSVVIKREPLNIRKVEVERLGSISVSQYIPKDKTIFIDTSKTLLVKSSPTETLGFRGAGKKSSDQFLEQLYSQELKTAPILKPVKLNQPKIITSTPQSVQVESPTSVWAGTGMYERTESVSSRTMPSQIIPSKVNIIQPMKTTLKTESILSLKPASKTKSGNKNKVVDILKQNNIENSFQDNIQSQTQKVKQAQSQDFLQRLLQKTRQVTTQGFKFPQPKINPPKINPPKIKTPKIPIPNSSQLKGSSKKSEGGFDVFITNKGKIGTSKTKQKAEELLQGFLGKTLSASGFIEKGGKKLKVSELSLGQNFGKSKVSSTLVVEKKEKRLRRGTTGKDIQYFR